MSRYDKLTDQQQRFVDAYLSSTDMSIQEAALSAGYSEKSINSQAYQLLRNPKVARAVDKEMAARARRTRITQDRVLREIASIAFSNIDDYEVDSNGNVVLRDGADIRAMKAVSSVEKTIVVAGEDERVVKVKLKLWDKNKAQEMLSKHMNLFKEHQESGVSSLSDDELNAKIEQRYNALLAKQKEKSDV